MPPSEAQEAVERFKRLIEAQDRRASAQMIRAYAPVYQRLQRDTIELLRIARERKLKPWQVMRLNRLRDLERQFLANVAVFAGQAEGLVTQSQLAAVGLAQRGAEQTVAAGLPRGITMENLSRLGIGWDRLPEEAFANFVGIAGDGAPLGQLFAELGPEAAPKIRDAISTGVALGKGPRATAQLVRVQAGMPLSRALLITRTETNRAYRESTRFNYANNSRLVKGYRRHCFKGSGTCVACIALDGTLYGLDEPLNEHPNGRCTLIPEVLDYRDLGYDLPPTPPIENARDWLAKQPEYRQRELLGSRRFDAWQDGRVQLDQLATIRGNRVWGDSAVVKPLRDLGI